jgi:hypothetical protein
MTVYQMFLTILFLGLIVLALCLIAIVSLTIDYVIEWNRLHKRGRK